jgi:hypothetical protein
VIRAARTGGLALWFLQCSAQQLLFLERGGIHSDLVPRQQQ